MTKKPQDLDSTKQQKPSTENRDQQFLRRLSNIEHKVDSIDQTTAFALRADAKRHLEIVRQVFRKSKRRAQVYLAANSRRSVQEIAELIGIPKPNNVSAELRVLAEEGLLEVIEKADGKVFWGKKSIDHTLKISQTLMKEFELNRDGVSVS